ncbi:hypothetical protein LIA77_10372 [Sarocladium implicatum]|nr:hypothetical protein LIA77_10372 [Sarocladium implicatum]
MLLAIEPLMRDDDTREHRRMKGGGVAARAVETRATLPTPVASADTYLTLPWTRPCLAKHDVISLMQANPPTQGDKQICLAKFLSLWFNTNKPWAQNMEYLQVWWAIHHHFDRMWPDEDIRMSYESSSHAPENHLVAIPRSMRSR